MNVGYADGGHQAVNIDSGIVYFHATAKLLAMSKNSPSAQQGRPQTQFWLGVVPSLVVLSQHRLLSTLIVQALQLGSLRHRLPQSRRPSDCSARPPSVLRPPLMKAPSATAQPGEVIPLMYQILTIPSLNYRNQA